MLVAREQAEEVLATRAIDGVEEEVWYHGEVVATRRRYDSRLLLAHLARLDRLTQNADTAALADDFDMVLERLERGEQLPPPPEPEPAAESCSGQCNMRSKSHSLEERRMRSGTARSELPELERRLRAMEAALPKDAPPLPRGEEGWEMEALRLEAFEIGLDAWWQIATEEELEARLTVMDAAAGEGARRGGCIWQRQRGQSSPWKVRSRQLPRRDCVVARHLSGEAIAAASGAQGQSVVLA